MSKALNRILIIKPSSLGDIIHGLLVAQAIRAQLPGIQIDWIVRKEFADVVHSASAINHTYLFERKGGLKGFKRLITEIRQEPYDAVLDMQGLARSGILTAAARSPRKLGRSDAREGARLAYNELTAKLPKDRPTHAAAILAGFLQLLGLDATLSHSIEFKPAESPLELPAPSSPGKRVLVFPESRRAEKNWADYEALTRELLEQESVSQVIWCGHLPVQPEQPIETDGFINLTAQTTINQLPELMRSADCIVSNDSGPMHLAAALDRPLVALFGPTPPERFGPYPSKPQQQRVIRRADGNMTSISLDEVKQAVLEVLNPD